MREQSQVLKTVSPEESLPPPSGGGDHGSRAAVVTELFAAYMERPQELPEAHGRQPHMARAVADYIAGMTDRFAIREHERLSGAVLFP